jgi:hypothetical protein
VTCHPWWWNLVLYAGAAGGYFMVLGRLVLRLPWERRDSE